MLALAGLRPGAPGTAVPGPPGFDEDDDAGDAADLDGMSYEQLLALQAAAGHVSRAAPRAVVDRLRTRAVATPSGVGSPRGEDKCAVCQFEWAAGDEQAVLPCGHAYHAACVKAWLGVSKACPICKADVVEAERKEEEEDASPKKVQRV